MQLADDRLISQLTEAYNAKETRSRTANPRMTRTQNPEERVYQPPSSRLRRCRCGECVSCKDNARWERIFAEKFADPTYYSSLAIRRGSPLHLI